MSIRFTLTILFLIGIALCHVNSYPAQRPGSSLISKQKNATSGIDSLWKQGRRSFRNGDSQVQFNRSRAFLELAYRLSDSLNRQDLRNESILRIGELYFLADSLKKGVTYFDQVIKYYQKKRTVQLEAATWLRLARMSSREIPHSKTEYYLEMSKLLYQKIHDWQGEASASWRISYIHAEQGKLKLAEQEMMKVIALKKAHGDKNALVEYSHLADFGRRSGNLNKALIYSFKCLHTMYLTKDTAFAGLYYVNHGNILRDLGNTKSSIIWYRKALGQFLFSFQEKPEYVYGSAAALVRALIEVGRPKEGLKLMINLANKQVGLDAKCKIQIDRSLGAAYFALQQYKLAEKHFNRAEELIDKNQYTDEWIAASRLRIELAEFHIHQKKYEKAFKNLNVIFIAPKETISLTTRVNAYLLLSKVDSARGNYAAALQDYKNYKGLNDSIFNTTKNNQIEELQIAYATAQNQKNLKLLQDREKLQKLKLAHTENTQRWTVGVAVLLLLLLGVSYNGYRLKQRSNLKLKAQRKENEMMNENLKSLVSDKDTLIKQKDHLLREKEWLLKEVHHRVKNNLHTVFCLLESQAAYLRDDALKAIESSQHRIYAMSLIHQKLYQSNEVKAIEMDVYLEEFIKYLSDSFGVNQDIKFILNIDPLKLDISQAIPLSLVINEAVTNAIKYAFVKKRSGVIKISMHRTTEDIILEIADNGIGIDSAIIMLPVANTLGLKLMKGLCDDVNATIQFSNESGTRITVNIKTAHVNNVNQVFGASLV